MTLSALIKKGGLAKAATATVATIATLNTIQAVTVAPVATVAVAEEPEPRIEPKREPTSTELSTDENTRIRAWLSHIKETDPGIIAEILDKCRTDSDLCQYILQRTEEVPPTAHSYTQKTCGGCAHFKRINHPSLGHCARGEPEAIAGLWDTSQRFCKSYRPLIDQQGDYHDYN